MLADRHTLNPVEFLNPAILHANLAPARLVEHALSRNEGRLAANGALCVLTGEYTGRSPQDKYLVDREGLGDDIWWGPVNRTFPADQFDRLSARVMAYLQNRECFVFEGAAGAHPAWRWPVRFINEFAWQNLFVHQLFVRTQPDTGAAARPPLTVVAAPGFKAVPEVDGTRTEAFILLDLVRRLILIGGTHYAGELKKAIFTAMNYFLPRAGVLPMHCSANTGAAGDVALFFGLSGTGKTTLSADPERHLIGDDEHGWSDEGVFNLEGGCYAKCIRLSREREPQIWDAIRFGTVLENVVVEPLTREVDYDSERLTENTRAAYPVDFIPGAVGSGTGGHPRVILFLTADAFGVLPPIARLSPQQAMFHFLSGYTSKLAGTERGVTRPEATFSPCFGAPFLPLHPTVYARMLGEKMRQHGTRVYLVNTGWYGGPYGVGRRIDLVHTRAMVRAAISGEIERAAFVRDPVFGLETLDRCPGVPGELLQPRRTWNDPAAYDRQATEMARRFVEHLDRLTAVPQEIKAAGPPAR